MVPVFPTLVDQEGVQELIDELYQPYDADKTGTLFKELELKRRLHIAYLLKGLEKPLASGFTSLDASKPWICYWIVHSLDVLGYRLSSNLKQRIIATIASCQHPDGGFGGGQHQLAHLACTFAAISTLVAIGTVSAYDIVDREGLLRYLLRMKQPSGGFTVHEDGEMDVRGSYCAIAVASLTGLLTPALRANSSSFIRSCQAFDGGIGAVPGAEAHAGYTYCGVAALSILDELPLLDLHALDRFAVRSQCQASGGFRGRTHKLVDACYSFWSGALFPLLRRVCPAAYFDAVALQKYILICSQNGETGGFRDKPGKMEDFYHTCYALSGLALAQRETPGNLDSAKDEFVRDGGIVLGDPTNLLPAVLPEYNLLPERIASVHQYFSSEHQ